MSVRRNSIRRRMSRRHPLPAALLLLLALTIVALSACGSDRLSDNQLRSQASAICARTAQAIDNVPVPNTPDQGGRFLRRGLLQLGPQLTRLRALRAPTDLDPEYQQALTSANRELATISTYEERIRGGADVIDTFRALETTLTPIVENENRAWTDLELPACLRR